MNLKDKAFLKKFSLKQSSILICLENVGPQFPIIGVLFPFQSSNDQTTTHQSPSSQIFHPSHKTILHPIFTWNKISVKYKNWKGH